LRTSARDRQDYESSSTAIEVSSQIQPIVADIGKKQIARLSQRASEFLPTTQLKSPNKITIMRCVRYVAVNFSSTGIKLGQRQACALGIDLL
jgi:hypothetical protein